MSAEMPFLDHLEELRARLLWSLGAVALGTVVAFVLISQVDVIGILERPILPFLSGRKLVYTHPGDPFGIVMKAAFILGVILALPVILYQVWAFLSPALYAHEKRVAIPVFISATVLFMAGVALAYFAVLPLSLRFLLNFQAGTLEPMITASDYFGFAITMSLAFGAVFELPILVLALTALGLLTPMFLNKYRRHAVILVMVGSAFITPGGDPISLVALAIPLYLLFELSVALSYVVYRRRERQKAKEEAAALESRGSAVA